MPSGIQAVSQSLQQPGVRSKMQEVAKLQVGTIADAQRANDDPNQHATSRALQSIRNIMSMFDLVTGTNVGSDGYRKQCRHAGQAYTQMFGPPFLFTTPNLADTRRINLLLVQNAEVSLEDGAGDVVSYAELRQRLTHNPVGQAIRFELLIRLFHI